MTEIRCENISVQLADTSALEDVSFSLASGSRTAVLGPSGAGKTTLLRVIAGLQAPSRGKVYFDAEDVTELQPFQRHAAVIFQQDSLFMHTRVKDNIAYGMHKLGYDRSHIQSMVAETAQMVGIGSLLERFPSALSGGERQRVGIARALVRRPKILLLDEPFASLDTRLKEQLQQEILRIQEEQNLTMIEVTHDQREAELMGEKILLLDHGRVQSFADPASMRNDPDNLFTASFFSDPRNNILSGYIHAGSLLVCGMKLPLAQTQTRTVRAVLRPDQIMISEDGIACVCASCRSLRGRVLCDLICLNGGMEHLLVLTDTPLNEGEEVHVSFAPEDLHLFDARSGERVRVQFLR